MSLLRLNDFLSGTTIQSSQVDDEFNQLVQALNGVKDVDIFHKFSHATAPVLTVNQLGAGLIQKWQQNSVDRATLSALGKLLLPAGIGATPSTDQISNFGVYFEDPNARVTGANVNETDLSSKTVSANVFANNGDFIIGIANLSYGANANTKRYRIYYGGVVFYDSGAVVFNGVEHFLLFVLVRLSATSSRGIFLSATTGFGTGSTVISTFDNTVNHGNSNILKSTGQNGAAVANDVFQINFTLLKGSV